MAQATDERVERFRREVLPVLVERFRPEAVIVFGSRVRGDALKDSDLDVLVVSADFEGVPWLERPVRVYRECDIRFGVELLCYTPAEFARKREELGIVQAALREGVDLLRERRGAPGPVAGP